MHIVDCRGDHLAAIHALILHRSMGPVSMASSDRSGLGSRDWPQLATHTSDREFAGPTRRADMRVNKLIKPRPVSPWIRADAATLGLFATGSMTEWQLPAWPLPCGPDAA